MSKGQASSSEFYHLKVKWARHTMGDIGLFVDFNIFKINVGIRLPKAQIHGSGRQRPYREFIEEIFGSVLEGARHEGYSVDEHVSETSRHVSIVSRVRVSEDFIWDPSRQLHFVQDLRYFLLSFAAEWCKYLHAKAQDGSSRGAQ